MGSSRCLSRRILAQDFFNMPQCETCKTFTFVDAKECPNCTPAGSWGPAQSHLRVWLFGSAGAAIAIWILWAILT